MNYIHLETIDSTSTYLKNNINTLPNNSICYSDYQTNGRGRITHTWDSEKGKNIIVSFLFKDFNIINNLSLITYSIAVGVRKFLLNYVKNIYIKWPNDIYINNKKICGILSENIITSTNNIIIGIGININQTNFNNLPTATSLILETNKKEEYNIEELIKELSIFIMNEINKFKKTSNKKYLIRYLNKHLYGKDKKVEYIKDNNKIIGTLKYLSISKKHFASIIIKDNKGNKNYIISNEIKFI